MVVKSKLIGVKVDITTGFYAGHWGYVRAADGRGMYHLEGGSLGGVSPLVHRSEFKIARAAKLVIKKEQTSTMLMTTAQIIAIGKKLTAMAARDVDVDSTVEIDASGPVVQVNVRTATKSADVWQQRESFFVEPTGYLAAGETTLLLTKVDKPASVDLFDATGTCRLCSTSLVKRRFHRADFASHALEHQAQGDAVVLAYGPGIRKASDRPTIFTVREV
jgi:hypothetical protein